MTNYKHRPSGRESFSEFFDIIGEFFASIGNMIGSIIDRSYKN
jgi:hypothetical protein